MKNRTNRTTKSAAKSGSKSARGSKKTLEQTEKGSANTCEESVATVGESGCGCGPTLVRVWSSPSSCCDGPVFVSRPVWYDDGCCCC